MPRRREPPQPLLKEGLPFIAGELTKVFVFVIVFVLRHARHDAERARYGGEYGESYLDDFVPVDLF